MLWKWANYVTKTTRLNEELAWARMMRDDALDTLRAQNISGMPRGGGKSDLCDVVAAHERIADDYAQLVVKIEAEIADVFRLRNAVEELVAQLPALHEKIISYRYIDGHSWRWIAIKTNYDESQARRIERQAVDFVAEHIEA